MNDFREYAGKDYSSYLMHYGVSKTDGAKVGSGRYPLGSGDRPYQDYGGVSPKTKHKAGDKAYKKLLEKANERKWDMQFDKAADMYVKAYSFPDENWKYAKDGMKPQETATLFRMRAMEARLDASNLSDADTEEGRWLKDQLTYEAKQNDSIADAIDKKYRTRPGYNESTEYTKKVQERINANNKYLKDHGHSDVFSNSRFDDDAEDPKAKRIREKDTMRAKRDAHRDFKVADTTVDDPVDGPGSSMAIFNYAKKTSGSGKVLLYKNSF